MPFSSLLAWLALVPASVAAADRDRATIVMPIIVDAGVPAAPTVVATNTVFARQPAHHRSVRRLDTDVVLPPKVIALPLHAGDLLVELAASGGVTGPVFCRGAVVRKTAVTLCLADRDGDGAFDQLWSGGAASVAVLTPHPDIRLVGAVEPVRSTEAIDADADFTVGLYVSGSNPLLGEHHLYVALASGDTFAPLLGTHRAARLTATPKAVEIGGGAVTIGKADGGRYAISSTQPMRSGEWTIVEAYPTRTMIISVPR